MRRRCRPTPSAAVSATALFAALVTTTALAPAARAAGLSADWKPAAPLWETARASTRPAPEPAPKPAALAQAGPDAVAPLTPPSRTETFSLPDEARPLQPGQLPTTLPGVPGARGAEVREAPAQRLSPRDELPAQPDVIPARTGAGIGTETTLGLPLQQLNNLPRPYTPPEVPPTEAGEPRSSVVADELSYDDEAAVVTARGGVEIIYQGRVLRADTVRYDTAADRVTAEGNVVLMETDGSVLFFDYAELTGDMKEGFAREVTLLLADRSRAVAEDITREDQTNVLREAVYTACDPCEDPDADPLWRLRARTVTHDEAEKTVTYRDAWLEIGGLPVFYTPYLQHPDPTVKRKSGVLAPSYGTSSELGTEVSVPYYFVIDDSQDLLTTLRYTSDEGAVLEAAYAGLYEDGALEFGGSVTKDSEGRVRNHVRSGLTWHFDDTWRGGLSVNLASDDTYLRRYRYGTDAWLVSQARMEGFGRRSYARARGFYFQELREDRDPGRVPVVLPDASYSYASAPTDAGTWWTFDSSALALTRSEGTDTRRIAGEATYNYIHYGSLGDVTEVMAALRADVYSIDSAEDPRFRTVDSATTGRVIPTAGFLWRWPFVRDNGWFREVVEPVVSAYISPRGQNKDDIPNEDSRDFEFDATNLFARNRFTGWDRVENGPRANYGIRWAGYWPGGESVSAVFGQAWHMYDDGFFGPESGLDEDFSDYVGRVSAGISPWLNLHYGFRIDRDDFSLQRTEIVAEGGLPVLNVSATYLLASGNTTIDDQFGDREELSLSAASRISQYWSLFGGTVWDLEGDPEPRDWSIGGVYEDECFTLSAAVQRDFTDDRDYEGGTSAMLRVVFKSLGEIDLGSGGIDAARDPFAP